MHANQTPPPSAYEPRPFSVAPDKQILFSSGNLQYNAAQGSHLCADGTTQPGTWRFAEHQWDYVGDAANGTVYENGVKCNNAKVSDTYDGWIDFFCWGTSGWNSGAMAYQPWATSLINADYISEGNEYSDMTGDFAFADWGIYNEINGEQPGTWRSMTKEESYYLLHERPDADKLFGLGTVNDMAGLILLPDDWITPSGVTFVSGGDKGMVWSSTSGIYYSNNGHFMDNVYTEVQWQQMENAGAVFLPAVGYRYGATYYYVGKDGNYWLASTTVIESAPGACYIDFPSNCLYPERHNYRYYGFSVRLVKDYTPPPSTYEPRPFSVSADKQILFSSGNLQYNAAQGTHPCADGTTQPGTWRFAEHQYDYVGDAAIGNVYQDGVKCNNELISNTYDGWIDLFGWGTSGWNSGAKEYQPWAKSKVIEDYCPGGDPTNNLTGAYAFADWGIYNAIDDDPSGTWRTMSTEEWIYLLHKRADYAHLFGYGTVNGIQGLILLPDSWQIPEDIPFTPSTEKGLVWQEDHYESTRNHYSDNIYTLLQWSKMEASGAVFLPCVGWRNGVSTTETDLYGDYWSTSSGEESAAYFLRFRADELNPQYGYNRYRGRSVRLVKDVEQVPPPEEGCTDVTTEFSYTMYKGETYQWENTEYQSSGDYTKTYPKADGCDSIVTLHLTVLPPECLGYYDTVRFCHGYNAEHDEVVRHGYCIRYLPYRYESPAEWDFMEDVILMRDSDRTLVDLARAERNLKEHYTEDLTPVQSVSWSLRKEGTHEYHAITVQSEAQWIEAGTLSLSVYFLCGQRYYSDFTTDIDNINVSDKPVKILMDGHIYILRGDHIFDTQGKAVK